MAIQMHLFIKAFLIDWVATLRSRRHVLNPDYPLGRRSGEGRNPVIKTCRKADKTKPLAASFEKRPNHNIVPLVWEFANHLDTGLRRYDVIFANNYLG